MTTQAQSCACQPVVCLQVEQGATLSVKITLTLDGAVVDVTGAWFEFTAKPTAETPDNDPSCITHDWQETATSTQGITWLVLAASVTASMQTIAYLFQVRMVSANGVVTPLVSCGTLTVLEPVSSRYQPSPA
jgi:hypothetical protein